MHQPSNEDRRRRGSRRGRRLGALLAGTLILAACGRDDDSAGSVSTSAPPTSVTASSSSSTAAQTSATSASVASTEPAAAECDAPSGSLNIAMFAAPRSLDPVSLSSGLGGLSEGVAIYDTLVRYDAARGEYVPQLAASLEPNAAFDRWTLTLRPEVTFPDGTSLDADAVVANLARQRDPKFRSPNAGLLALVTSVTAVEPTIVEIGLSAPWPSFPMALSQGPGMIANPRAVADFATAPVDGLPPAAIGAGPYSVERWAASEEMVLKAKSERWGTPACTETLRLTSIPGGEATLDAFHAGDVDVAIVNEPKTVEEVKTTGLDHLERFAGVGIILMNAGKSSTPSPTADPRVRKAVALGLDTRELLNRADDGAGVPLQGAIVPPAAEQFTGIVGSTLDREEARRLVDEVKAETGWDGSIRWTCHAALNDLALAVQAQLGTIGMSVELDLKVSSTELVTAVYGEKNFDMVCWGFRYGLDEDPWPTFNSGLRSDSAVNRTGFASPEMDAALVLLREAKSVDERADALSKIQAILNEEAPVFAMRVTPETVLWRSGVDGVTFGQNGIIRLAGVRGS